MFWDFLLFRIRLDLNKTSRRYYSWDTFENLPDVGQLWN